MRVCGFTIIRNAQRFDYPIVEAIRSVLPVVDEFVVLVGNSDDDTRKVIESIGSSKIRIYDSVWDDSLRKGGQVLAVETDKAYQAIDPQADWCIYLQADEVLHEDDYPSIRASMQQYLNDKRTEGLLFDYVHFYGSYTYYGNSRRWYRREIRIVRHDPGVHSFRDAQGFRLNNRMLNVRRIPARVFHYGWVKNPNHQREKQQNFHKMWHSDEKVKTMVKELPFDYSQIDALEIYTGTHPAVMKDRIRKMDWEFQFDTGKRKMKLKDSLLFYIEKYTGKRLFEYRNYRLL